MNDETALLRQAPSPSENVELLAKAEARYDIQPGDIAGACYVDEQTVARWRRNGLFGEQSAAAIGRLIDASKRRHAGLVETFTETAARAGLRTHRDLLLAGIDLGWSRYEPARDLRYLQKWFQTLLRPHHLMKLREYIRGLNAALRVECRREARHFGRGR